VCCGCLLTQHGGRGTQFGKTQSERGQMGFASIPFNFFALSTRRERDSLASIVRRAAPSGRTARVSQTIQARRTSRYPFALICYFLLSFEDNSFHCFQLNSTCLGTKNVTMLKTTFSVAKSVYWSQ